jgi:hypothetical protein
MSLFSTNDSSRIGKYGDFTIYSLPKFFLFSLGVLQYNNDLYKKDVLNDEEQPFQIYLKKTSFFLKHEEENRYKRRINYLYYVKKNLKS